MKSGFNSAMANCKRAGYEEAKKVGQLFYIGLPCVNCSGPWHYVSTKRCVTCNRARRNFLRAKKRYGLNDKTAKIADCRKKAEAIRERIELENRLSEY